MAEQKTNVMRALDQKKVRYTPHEYPHGAGAVDGVTVAGLIGVAPEQVFKTLVLSGERNGYLVCCIPSNCELDLKKVAKVAGDKRVEMIPMKQLLPLTGYIRGGCSPLGMKKKFPTFIDETAMLFDEIAISAGERGTQIIMNGEQLASFIGAPLVDLCAS